MEETLVMKMAAHLGLPQEDLQSCLEKFATEQNLPFDGEVDQIKALLIRLLQELTIELVEGRHPTIQLLDSNAQR